MVGQHAAWVAVKRTAYTMAPPRTRILPERFSSTLRRRPRHEQGDASGVETRVDDRQRLFRRFEEVMRKLVKIPKKKVDEKIAAERRAKDRRKPA
jgi:hypothetical protein